MKTERRHLKILLHRFDYNSYPLSAKESFNQNKTSRKAFESLIIQKSIREQYWKFERMYIWDIFGDMFWFTPSSASSDYWLYLISEIIS